MLHESSSHIPGSSRAAGWPQLPSGSILRGSSAPPLWPMVLPAGSWGLARQPLGQTLPPPSRLARPSPHTGATVQVGWQSGDLVTNARSRMKADLPNLQTSRNHEQLRQQFAIGEKKKSKRIGNRHVGSWRARKMFTLLSNFPQHKPTDHRMSCYPSLFLLCTFYWSQTEFTTTQKEIQALELLHKGLSAWS